MNLRGKTAFEENWFSGFGRSFNQILIEHVPRSNLKHIGMSRYGANIDLAPYLGHSRHVEILFQRSANVLALPLPDPERSEPKFGA